MTTSMLPSAAWISAARATTASWSRMSSALTWLTLPPARPISATARSSPAASMSVRKRSAPSRAAASAVARPMPLAAPVMKQRLPLRLATGTSAEPVPRLLGLDPERVQGHRQHLVVADQHAELDQPHLVEPRGQQRPELVADPPVGVHLVVGAQEQRLALAPPRGVWPGAHALDLLGAQPGPLAEPLVVPPLVLGAGVVGDPQDHQLGLCPRQFAAGHQRPREPEPAPEEAMVAGQGGEDVRRPPTGREPEHADDAGVDQPDLPASARANPHACPLSHAPTVAHRGACLTL